MLRLDCDAGAMLMLLMGCTRYLLGLAAIFDILKEMVGG